MKLHHRRYLDGPRKGAFASVSHYGYGDSLADRLAATIRKEIGCKARVVQDQGSGFRHVFVPEQHEQAARDIAFRPEFN